MLLCQGSHGAAEWVGLGMGGYSRKHGCAFSPWHVSVQAIACRRDQQNFFIFQDMSTEHSEPQASLALLE